MSKNLEVEFNKYLKQTFTDFNKLSKGLGGMIVDAVSKLGDFIKDNRTDEEKELDRLKAEEEANLKEIQELKRLESIKESNLSRGSIHEQLEDIHKSLKEIKDSLDDLDYRLDKVE